MQVQTNVRYSSFSKPSKCLVRMNSICLELLFLLRSKVLKPVYGSTEVVLHRSETLRCAMIPHHTTDPAQHETAGDISNAAKDALPMELQTRSFLPRPVFEPIQLQARRVFLQDIIVPTPNSSPISRGHFANLASTLKTSSEIGYLQTAVNAVALTVLATRFNVSEARPLAMSQYVRSIVLIRTHMEKSSTHGTEHLVAAMSLLSLYEVRTLIWASQTSVKLADVGCTVFRSSTRTSSTV